ncbi:MAG TPA: glycosyl hydrolase family 28-related protein [Alphaproteobacteria bacterium]|nr:glycosyl hydrolase family 28-related protein [Alphaproteobacteria bacterium]
MTEHIKMPAASPLVRYVVNGTQTVFQYPFPIFASEDLAVYFDGARQYSGFDVSDVGETAGGLVTFDEAPYSGIVLTLERRLPLERVTDFIEGGDFSAQAINNELDYLTASVQQVNRDLSPMLRYSDHETPGNVVMPQRALRANKALGFDGNGDPIAVSLEGSMAAPDYTAGGMGAVTRTMADKFSDRVSVKDFGAKGDGLTDDTLAIQQALTAYDSVFLPEGNYLISATITISARQTLTGAGNTSVLVCQGNSFNAIEVVADYAALSDFKITGGNIGIKLYGRDRPCVQTAVSDIVISQSNIGVQLDGHNDTNKPCYWNNFDRVLVEQPAIHGFHLTKSGAGDTPNANKFYACRAYSLGADITGAGFYIEHGQYNNSYIDCEANVKGTAQGCFIIGANSNKTLLINPYAESNNQVPNIKLESGSIETAIYNLLSASDGAAIWDLSGGEYTAYNAGYPYKNRLQKTTVTDMNATLQRYDTEFIDSSGTITLDTSHSVHLVSSFGGALTVELPNAADAVGVMMAVKKTDSSGNVITITEDGGNGPDGRNYYLGAENDFVQMISNGAEWFVISSNRAPGNTRYYDGSGIYDIDMAVDTYLLSGYGGALEARLPPANAPEAIGRTVTIKKTDVSSNVITVSELGGSGPDGYAQPLTSQYKAITVVSDGGHWYIVSKF